VFPGVPLGLAFTCLLAAVPGGLVAARFRAELARGDSRPIVSVVAPPGYGKTALPSQWAEANGQAFAWVSAEEPDNDPKNLLSYVAKALDAVEPIDERVFNALASPASSVPGSVVPGSDLLFIDVLAGGAGSSTTCTRCTTGSAGRRCRCW
jgi:hypothetical protein